MNAGQSKTIDDPNQSFLVTGNPPDPEPLIGGVRQRSFLLEFLPKLISSDSQFATPRRLWGAVSSVRSTNFSPSAR